MLLLHGLGDNRVGMTAYAQLLITHGFIVLIPDARAHGTSGGPLNGTLLEILAARPGLRYLLVHNVDTLGADVDPALLGFHADRCRCLTFEVIGADRGCTATAIPASWVLPCSRPDLPLPGCLAAGLEPDTGSSVTFLREALLRGALCAGCCTATIARTKTTVANTAQKPRLAGFIIQDLLVAFKNAGFKSGEAESFFAWQQPSSGWQEG